jgi:cell wall-associated NlpC family hydrolase
MTLAAVLALGLLSAAGGPAVADNDGQPSGPLQAGGGAQPGERPPADGVPNGPRSNADAAPPIDPGFVDDYSRLWKQVERGKLKIRSLSQDLIAANQVLSASSSDLSMALRVRNRAELELSDAQDQFGVAVRDMYITGTTDVDVILGVLGSKPEDVLRNIDSVVYLRTATGTESADFDFARDSAVVTQSAAAASALRTDDDRERVDVVRSALAKTKRELERDRKELQRLVSVAAPQTVVGSNGCPKEVLEGTVPEGINIKQLCGIAVRTAPSPQAAFAIKWALVRLGAPYACEGIGRLEAWRYDCSSYVSRAYAEGAGLRTAGKGWAPSTRNMVPWDGASLDPHYAVIPPKQIRPGDLVLYDTCPAGETCPYRHVVMYLGPVEKGGVPMMAHTNSCGSVAHVVAFTGTDAANFLGVRRVVPLSGEKVIGSLDPPKKSGKADKPGKAGKPKKPKGPNAPSQP